MAVVDGDLPDFELQYARIRQQFVAGLPRRLQDIAEASGRPALEATLHRLAGAAGSFGYEALGLLAREAMAAVQAQDAVQQSLSLARLELAVHDLCRTGNPGDTIP